MQKPKGRYVKRNPIDYILIALTVVLLGSLLFRGIAYIRQEGVDRRCEARVEFIIRAVDQEGLDRLQGEHAAFCLTNGTALPAVRIVKISQTEEYVPDDDGNMNPVVSARTYDVHMSFVASGDRAEDGTFLLSGMRRLSVGDRLPLVQNGHTYTADFVSVQIF